MLNVKQFANSDKTPGVMNDSYDLAELYGPAFYQTINGGSGGSGAYLHVPLILQLLEPSEASWMSAAGKESGLKSSPSWL